MPVPPPSTLEVSASWITPHMLEFCYTAWNMTAFGSDLGYDGAPFCWDTECCAIIRAEINALMFQIYDIDRPDVDYILDTFPIIRKQNVKQWGEHRTKRLILERYDAMTEADNNGQPYQTILDPSPAHPSIAHDISTRPTWYRPAS